MLILARNENMPDQDGAFRYRNPSSMGVARGVPVRLPIFIITSFYGMNFPHFPPSGTDLRTAYLWVFGTTGVCTGVLYLFLKRKGWF